MRILLTNYYLEEYTGTEVSTYNLAKYLTKNNQKVTVYAPFSLGPMIDIFKKIDVGVIDDLQLIKNQTFDIAHIHHNICAYQVRYNFPNLPMIMWIHGLTPYLEQPPIINLNINKYLVINEELVNHLTKLHIPRKKIILYRDIVDDEKFKSDISINKVPQKVLIISNHINQFREKMLINICSKLNLKYRFIGQRFQVIPNSKLMEFINWSDLVITSRMGAIESMFCGRIPLIFEYGPSDGLVTSDNFKKLMTRSFSGRTFKKKFNQEQLKKEIGKYNQSDGVKLKEIAKQHYSAENRIRDLINIYQEAINLSDFQPINNFLNENLIRIITETKFHAIKNVLEKYQSKDKYRDLELVNHKLKGRLAQIQDSKIYTIYRYYKKIKEKILFNN